MALKTDNQTQNTQIRIRKVGHDDLDDMTRVVARAYDKDPFINWMAFQDEKRTERIETFFKVSTEHYTLQYGHVFATEDLCGVAMWYPPEPHDCWKGSTLKDLRFLHKWISVCGVRQFLSRMLGYGVVKKHHVKEIHYYLNVIAVDPARQGNGIGSHLIQHGLRMCNEKRLPAYLECATEENVRFYQKNDFKVSEEFTVPRGPKIWTMIYEP